MKSNTEEKRYRYPGVQPFSVKDQEIFKGRDADVENLRRKLYVQNLVVLQSKSGYGKSSLINAGIIPLFENVDEEYNYCIFSLQFNDVTKSPLQLFYAYLENVLTEKRKIATEILIKCEKEEIGLTHKDEIKKFLEYEEYLQQIRTVSLWQYFKSLELVEKIISFKTDLDSLKPTKFFIILDQFEKLLLYPDDKRSQIEDLGKEIADLYYKKTPSTFIEALQLEKYHDVSGNFLNKEFYEFWESQSDWEVEINKPIPISVLIGIRTDRLILIDRLSKVFPDLALSKYELSPLSVEGATEAITRPAQLPKKDLFQSEPFTYQEEAKQKILDFLSHKNNTDGSKIPVSTVEVYQLQMICQHIEEKIIEGKIIKNQESVLQIKGEDIDDLESIVRNYYEREMDKFPNSKKEKIKKFIECNLVDEYEERRVVIEEGTVYKLLNDLKLKDKEIEKILNQLESTTTRIVRRDVNQLGNATFELSHDRLVKPILLSKQKRERKQKFKKIVLLFFFAFSLIVGVVWSFYYQIELQTQEIELQTQEIELQTIEIDRLYSIKKIKNYEQVMDSLRIQKDSLRIQLDFFKASNLNPNQQRFLALHKQLFERDATIKKQRKKIKKDSTHIQSLENEIQKRGQMIQRAYDSIRTIKMAEAQQNKYGDPKDYQITNLRNEKEYLQTQYSTLLYSLGITVANNTNLKEELGIGYYVCLRRFSSQSDAEKFVNVINWKTVGDVLNIKIDSTSQVNNPKIGSISINKGKYYYVYIVKSLDLIKVIGDIDRLRKKTEYQTAFVLFVR